MTLKKSNGTINTGKVTALCAITGTIAAVVVALPTAFDYTAKGVAPWTQIPANQTRMEERLARIEKKVDLISEALNLHLADTRTNLSLEHMARQR